MENQEVEKTKKPRKWKIWELKVKIKEKDKVTVRRHAEECVFTKGSAGCVEWCYYGKEYWMLYVKCENFPEVVEVKAYPEVLAQHNDTPEIWNQLETGLSKDKSKSVYDVFFLFKTQRVNKRHKLVTWHELS